MNRRILVIEDNLEMSQNISAMVKLANYEVVVSNSGREGVELAQEIIPDLILCDIMMPDLDGYGVLHILSKDAVTANIPFIFLTAKSEPRDFRAGMNQGADDYITKPFDGVELFSAIEMRLKKNDLIKTTFRNNVTDINDFFIKAKQLPGFNKISEARLSKTYKKKYLIYMEGAQPLYLYFIAKGQVKTFKSNKDGKELITGLYNEGDFFGFLPLLENKPNNESAVVVKDADLFLIPQQDFLTMLYTNKEIARKFISMLSSNLYKTENQLIELAYQSVRHRVASALLDLNKNKGEYPYIITLSRRDISNMVGTSTESLNRTLADFKEEGVIEISDRGLRVLDLGRLELVAN